MNEALRVAVVDEGGGVPPGSPRAWHELAVHGRVKQGLHGPPGDLNGALLDDGLVVRLPPTEARRLATMIAPGAAIDVRGMGTESRLGGMVAANMIGPGAARMVQVAQPLPRRGGPPPPPAP